MVGIIISVLAFAVAVMLNKGGPEPSTSHAVYDFDI